MGWIAVWIVAVVAIAMTLFTEPEPRRLWLFRPPSVTDPEQQVSDTPQALYDLGRSGVFLSNRSETSGSGNWRSRMTQSQGQSGQTSTITKAEIDGLPEMLQTEFPDVWEQASDIQGAVPVLQREIRNLHDQGRDVSPLVKGVIALLEDARKHTDQQKREQGGQY